MKDHVLELAQGEGDLRVRLNLVREYLQACILRSLQESGAFAAWAFQGGTALRFLHGLRRFSENLDFALEIPEHDRGFEELLESVGRDLHDSGFAVTVKVDTRRTVHAAMVSFPDLLEETGLTEVRKGSLRVRVEVDTRPPAGAVLESRLVTRHFPLSLRAHDLSSCMAGKVHAVLARPYAKGRDLFDLGWYVTHPDRPQPNLELLRNALAQTQWDGLAVDGSSWREVVAVRAEELDWGRVVQDVSPFLEDPRDGVLLDRDLLLAELRR